ncbi:uncharacterized protein LOC131650901 [Vicia villosa]|uniref:uncharacterized protein LOC131650901 n=1 Tax=Vicia villosa TaxID=3911 RepID=UPI00273C7356|nr:uncharacterized protein LOC131650901 [Vicia villosa]
MHQSFSAHSEKVFDHPMSSNVNEEPNKEAKRFYGLVKDAEQKLYPGCKKFSKLSFIMRLFQMKCLYGWSNTSLDSLLKLLAEAFPEGNVLPSSIYEVKKIIKDLGLDYVKIDACANDCILYRGKDYENLDECPICVKSRWKENTKKNNVPNKIVRYFPIKPRLQRLFMSKQIAQDMKWHKNKRIDDGILRHPADSLTWKRFDDQHKFFSTDAHNIRLGLASDGFNPFGPTSPGNDIDVYLQPLIDDLKELWDVGIETYDASSSSNFQLHAALLWTINDFPAYGMLSGWSTKGSLACPCCNKETISCHLKYSFKQCYMGHRRFLPTNHPWRNNKSSFDNTREVRHAPQPLTGDDVIAQHENIQPVIFDVMHIEKNICESVIGTLLNIDGKTKDTLKSRLDLKHMGFKKSLCPIRNGDKYIIPPARYTMSLIEKAKFCQILKDVRFPDSYASNIGRCIKAKECKISGLKSHDYHVLFERIVPLAIRGLLPKDACDPLIELSLFFGDLCSKELKVDELDRLEKQMAITLCKLERIFPPSFFDVMVHLPIHLANEAKLGGPVQYRWMYPIERFLRVLKNYVRNKARPEGSIAEGYLAEECMIFCARYLVDMDSRLNQPDRYMDCVSENCTSLSVFKKNGRPIGGDSWENMSLSEILQAHFYILQNCEEVRPWIEEHMTKIRNESNINVEKRHMNQFHKWFENEVIRLKQLQDGRINDQLIALSRGPDSRVLIHNGYILNNFKFRAKSVEQHLKTQNSGVVVAGDELSGHVEYYGMIKKIVEVRYLDNNSVILLKCDWFEAPSQVRNQGRGYKKDEYGFISLDITKMFYRNDPFVLGSQAGSVYFVKQNNNQNWYTLVKVKPRNVYDFPQDEDDSEPYQLNEFNNNNTYKALETSSLDQREILNRNDIGGTSYEHTIIEEDQELKAANDASDYDTDDYEYKSSTDKDDYSDTEDSDSE